jgi:hypothetical protein
VIATKQCAKCLQTEEEGQVKLIEPEPTEQERQKLDIEMQHLIKSLSERKRRTFLRFMRGKKKNKRRNQDEDELEEENDEPVVRTKEELLEKLEKLKVDDNKQDHDDFYDSDFVSTDEED